MCSVVLLEDDTITRKCNGACGSILHRSCSVWLMFHTLACFDTIDAKREEHEKMGEGSEDILPQNQQLFLPSLSQHHLGLR